MIKVSSLTNRAKRNLFFQAFVMILFVGIITGAPRGPNTPKELKEGGAEHFKLKEGEADMAGERGSQSVPFQ